VKHARGVRRSFGILLIACVAAVALAVPPLAPRVGTTATASAATAVAGPKGVGSQQPGIAFESAGAMGRDLDAIRAAGMTWVRADFFWYAIQAFGRNSYDWRSTDAFVKAARARHLNVLALVAFSPAWARRGKSTTDPPDNPADYATFVHAAAKRYAPMGVHAWEIWNEPNQGVFWSPKADPVAYAALLKKAYPAIKSADRKAIVITGGLAPASNNGRDVSPESFVTNIYWHGAKGNFDAVGLHPYSFPYAPMYRATWNTFYRTPDIHAVMQAAGDGNKQVWGTEIGYPTGTNSKAVSDSQQAKYLVDAIAAWRKWSFAGPLFIFRLRDSSSDKGNVDDNMGLFRVSGQPKPSYSAVRRKLRP